MVRADGATATAVSVWKPTPHISSAAEGAEPQSFRMASQSEEKKEATLRKRAPRKKPIITGIWPCKINGCNKQFAREADLKRHQRTTKLHSMPSYACPQCDATFTRTDALRRHQKSRHNGIVIEPVEPNKGDDENSDTRSRSGTPSSKGKEKAVNIPVQTHQGTPTHSGPSSYYRSHTATISPFVPPRLQQAPQPSQVTLPMSAARTMPPWPSYPSSWQNGALPPNMGPISYIPHPMYYPSPHYRPHTNGYQGSQSPTQTPFHPQHTNGSVPSPSSQASTSAIPSRNSSSQPPSSTAPSSISNTGMPGIDPRLEPGAELTAAEVVAAVEAVLRQAESEEAAKKQKECEENQQQSHMESREIDRRMEGTDAELMDRNMGMEDGLNGMHGYGSSFERPEPMEHMLTEDGEPMLNPAELLTQESLASPPPS